MSENQQPNHDPLEEAIGAFRRMTVPDGPPDAEVLAQLGTGPRDTAGPHSIPFPWRRRYLMRLLIPSAAATLLALLVGGLLLMNGTAPVAFADVVENVKNAKSVTYVLKEKFESQAALEQEQTEQERIFYIHGNAHRVEFYSAQARGQAPPQAPLILLALIVDAKQKKA